MSSIRTTRFPAIRPHPRKPSVARSLPGSLAGTLSLLILAAPPTLSAQQHDIEWRNTTELTYLVSGGNSISSTLGIRNTLRRTGERGQLRVDLATVRTDATRIERTAVGTPDDFEVIEDEESVRTAERYSAQTRYDRTLTPRTFAYGSAGWERNAFAGFTSRSVLSTGAGAQWRSGDIWELKLAGGLTYTVQDDVTPDPERDDSYAGIRSTIDYARTLTSGTDLEIAWVIDANAQEWGDVRGNLRQAVSATLTDRLALKTTLQLLVDNQPPVRSVTLMTPGGEPTGEAVLIPRERVDRVLSVALVVTF